MRPIGVLVLGLLLFAGCASMRNSLRQEYVYAMARPCEGRGVTIQRVEPGGRTYSVLWTGGASTVPEFQECLRGQMAQYPYARWLVENGR